jgi:hypothetical protein
MKFLNKKERVLDIQLTRYGKAKLANRNVFDPAYYAFFDDDVIYDARYGGFIEGQNETEPRIKEDLQMEAPYLFNGLEVEIPTVVRGAVSTTAGSAVIGTLVLNNVTAGTRTYHRTTTAEVDNTVTRGEEVIETEKRKTDLTNPEIYGADYALGTAKLGVKNKSAWSVNVLNGSISSSNTHYSASTTHFTSSIPQLNFNPITYRSEVNRGNPSEANVADSYTSLPFSDETYLRVFEDSIVLEVNEDNTEFLNENYEIELFRVFDNAQIPGTGEKMERLEPLTFRKEPVFIKDGILLDEPEENFFDEPFTSNDVENYFEILVDTQIDEKTLCNLYPEDRADGVFNSRLLKCNDLEEEEKVNNENLYSSESDPNILDEEC